MKTKERANERNPVRVGESLYEYLKDADEVVMSPLANVSNRTEMTRVGNLDETVPVQEDVSHPAQNEAR